MAPFGGAFSPIFLMRLPRLSAKSCDSVSFQEVFQEWDIWSQGCKQFALEQFALEQASLHAASRTTSRYRIRRICTGSLPCGHGDNHANANRLDWRTRQGFGSLRANALADRDIFQPVYCVDDDELPRPYRVRRRQHYGESDCRFHPERRTVDFIRAAHVYVFRGNVGHRVFRHAASFDHFGYRHHHVAGIRLHRRRDAMQHGEPQFGIAWIQSHQ